MPNRDERYEVNVGTETDLQVEERAEGGAFRIALVGDYSGRAGRAGRAAAATAATAPRIGRPIRVDRDEIDATIAALAPALHLVLDPDAAPIVVRFAELDDFHPDRLAERLPLFQSLLEARRNTPASGARAQLPSAPRPNAAASSARALSEGSLLDMMLDAAPVAPPTGRTAPADELSDFVRQAVRPHALTETSAAQADAVAKIDAVLQALMRVLLHHPDFQALEALWRGTDFFLRRLDTDADLQVYLVDAADAEAVASLGGTWSLIVAQFSLGEEQVDLAARLAAHAHSLGAPIVAGAMPSLAGTPSFATTPDIDDWSAATPAGWDELRRSADAPFLGIALPRVFLRLPYGKATDACTVVPFEEITAGDADAHERYLWGSAAMACALIIAGGVQDSGEPATQGTLERLPLHVETVEGDSRTVPCAEATLGTRGVARLLDRGLIPLESMRDGDVIRAPRIQSVALPPRALAIHGSRSA